jgi:hypothetical protein
VGGREITPGTGPGARAAHFNGKDTYVHVPLTDALRLDVLTVEFWFRSTQAFDARFWPGSAVFISTATSGPGSGDWLITAASQRRVDEGRLLAETGPRGKTKDLYLESREGDPLNDGFWHHVVLTRSEEGKACLYVDGALHASGNDGRGRIVAERALNIGGESIHPGGKYLEGEMDEVAIYALVLSAERVRTHYEAIRPHLGNRPERRVVPVPVGKPAKRPLFTGASDLCQAGSLGGTYRGVCAQSLGVSAHPQTDDSQRAQERLGAKRDRCLHSHSIGWRWPPATSTGRRAHPASTSEFRSPRAPAIAQGDGCLGATSRRRP